MNFRRREFVETDLFEAMILLRRELEKTGHLLLCAGARVDTFPSAMCRDMGGGKKVYATRLGRRVTRDDLVSIFDDAASDMVGTVAEQAEFHSRWFRSVTESPDVGSLMPYTGAMEEAKRVPNGYVYRIAGPFGPEDAVPREAIVGA